MRSTIRSPALAPVRIKWLWRSISTSQVARLWNEGGRIAPAVKRYCGKGQAEPEPCRPGCAPREGAACSAKSGQDSAHDRVTVRPPRGPRLEGARLVARTVRPAAGDPPAEAEIGGLRIADRPFAGVRTEDGQRWDETGTLGRRLRTGLWRRHARHGTRPRRRPPGR